MSNPTRESLAQKDIEAGLKALGMTGGMAVEVHSSMSKLGFVEGGAPAVIRALMAVVGEGGAIVMSAYRVTPVLPLTEEEKRIGITAKVRKFDANADCRSGMGIIPDTFRKWPGTYLGEGIHRVCAWGHNARLHSQGYQYLLAVDGWVLLIGVDIHRCSCMHTAEDKVELPGKIQAYFELPEEIQRQYPQDEWYVEFHAPGTLTLEDAWGKIQAEAERRGLIRGGRIGQAECMLFKARPVVGIYEEYLRTDPFRLFGVDER